MSRVISLTLIAAFAWLITGCTTPSITNLTPSRLPRKENGQYLFEAQWESRQQSIVKDSIKAYVIIGLDEYPMERVTRLTNRWETLVPVTPGTDVVTYQFKFDYDYRSIPEHRGNSRLSKYHQLYILDN
jgi:hypothetical protein